MQDDELDPEERALVARLRALPPEGNEPDWHELEAAIRAEICEQVGAARQSRPWWRSWRWIVPVWAVATTAALALLVTRSGAPAEPQRTRATVPDAGGAHDPARPAPEPIALWLDGEVVELDDVPTSALDELDGDARAALAPDDAVSAGILPVADYGWIDTLDDDAVVAAEDWLKRNKS
jgi:hypothetical protein